MESIPNLELLPSLPVLFRVAIFGTALLLFVTALGHRCLRLLPIRSGVFDTDEGALLRVSLGAGLLQFLPFVMGAFHVLSVTNLRIALLVSAELLVPDALHVLRRARERVRAIAFANCSPATRVFFAALALMMLALFVRGLMVTSMVEDDGYHLTAPKRWLASNSLDYLPTYTHTNAPMGFEMLYTVGLVLGGASLAKSLHWAAGALCFFAISLIAKRLGYAIAGAITIACLLFENKLFDLAVLLNQAYVDLAVCWMMLVGLLVWQAFRVERDLGLLGLSATFVGLAATFKFIALSQVAALALVTTVEVAWRRRARVREAALSLAVVGSVPLVLVAPWLWRNWRTTNNPVYPMFWRLFQTRDWSPRHAEIFERFFHLYNWEPTLHLGERGRQLALLLGAAVTLSGLAFAIVKVRQAPLRDLLCFAAVLAACAFVTTGLYQRFLIPTFMLVVLVAACVSVERWRVSPRLELAPAMIMLLSLLKWGSWSHKDVPGAALVAIGARPDVHDDPLWNAWRFLNRATPRDTRILIGAFCPSFGRTSGIAFWVDRMTLTTDAHLQDAIPMRDWQAFLEGVERAHIDYVLMSDEAPHGDSAICSNSAFFGEARNEYPFTRRLVDNFGERVYTGGRLSAYRLNLTATPR